MSLPAPNDLQLIPVSSATGALTSTPAHIPIATTTLRIVVWSDQPFMVATTGADDTEPYDGNAVYWPGNNPLGMPVNRNKRTSLTYVHVKRAGNQDGTFYVSFYK